MFIVADLVTLSDLRLGDMFTTSVNKQRYWVALTLVHPNDTYVGVA